MTMDNLELAKQEIKLIDYVDGSKNKKGKYTFVNPCPICGHRDHFAIDNKNTWVSFSKCGSKYNGGSIIQLLCEIEHYDEKTAIKKTIEMAGRNEIKISPNQIKKEKAEKAFLKNKIQKQKTIINRCYHKLCNMLIVLRQIEKDAFLIWLYNFLDSYTDKFITDSHKEQYNLCLNFKTELHYSYMNFLSYENELNLILEEVKNG
jgi:hypothetical protein